MFTVSLPVERVARCALLTGLWLVLLAGGLGAPATFALAVFGAVASTLLTTALRSNTPRFRPLTLWLAALPAIVLARAIHLDLLTIDYGRFLLPWYRFIQQHGLAAWRFCFSDYAPLYTYAFGALALGWPAAQPFLMFKALSFTGEAVGALFVYRIVALQGDTTRATLATILFLLLPTIIINSAMVAQCDVWYAAFALGFVYFICIERPWAAVACFGIAFSLKLQTIFLAPFLAVLWLNRRVRWWHLPLIPAIYLATCIPAALAGRGWGDLALIYLHQATEYNSTAYNAPNLYLLAPQTHPLLIGYGGTALATLLMGVYAWRNRRSLGVGATMEKFLFLGLASVALTPFLLPRMHERYFILADCLSLLLAFAAPRRWVLPVLYQAISGACLYYFFPGMNYFLACNKAAVAVAMLVNTALSFWLYWRSTLHADSLDAPTQSPKDNTMNTPLRMMAIGLTVMFFGAARAHALDFQSVPTDTHGHAFADDDAQFDDLQGQAGSGQTVSFGGVTSYAPATGQGVAGAQTGAQLMDQGAIRTRR